ncbi:MAG: hypothetical protein ABI174_00820 [Chitinophagaceae bacterium]
MFTIVCRPRPLLEESESIFISNYENVPGTSLEMKIEAFNSQQATKAEDAALNEIDRLNRILSG